MYPLNPTVAGYHGEGKETCTQLWEGRLRHPVLHYISPPGSNPRHHVAGTKGTQRRITKGL